MIWFGRCLEIGTVLTWKQGDNPCMVGGNTANITAG